MNLVQRAQEIVVSATKRMEKEQNEKAEKVRSAEELASKLSAIEDLQDAIDAVIDDDIEQLRKLAKEEKAKLTEQKKALITKNSEFAEKAHELMTRAAELTANGRKNILKGLGRLISKTSSGIDTIISEIKAGM